MAYFDFSYLIKKYATTFIALVPGNGEYDASGDFVKGDPQEVELTGAIISHRESKIFRSEGTLTAQDRALYMLQELSEALQGAKVIHDGKIYTIESALQNAAFTNVYAYRLKYVSVFGGGGNNA